MDPADDPFDELQSVRVCLTRGEDATFELFPRDPGSYLVQGVAEGDVLDLDVIGFDLEPDEIRAGVTPRILGWARLEGVTVGTVAAPGYQATPFQRCADDCPDDCASPLSWTDGPAAVGLRRAEQP